MINVLLSFMSIAHWFIIIVRPLLSAELDYPCFFRPKLGTPKFYEIQPELY